MYRSLGEPGAEIPEVVGQRRQEVPRPGAPFDDLSQEGNASFVRAVDWFDPERGLRLSTYATWWICQSVRGLRDRGRAMISLPVHGGNRVAKAHAAHATLSAELGRDTGAAEELAVRLG